MLTENGSELKGENRMKKKIICAAIQIAIVGCLGSVAIGLIGSFAFGFEAAPIIGAGTIITAILCANTATIITEAVS